MNPRHPLIRRARGTTLVEAVVALAVMAFGMLAVVGVQSTLRFNADVAKQRSEAVRLGQAAIEADRAFSVLGTPASGQTSFATIANGTQTLTGYTTNTAYTIQRTVADRVDPERKDLRVAVGWTDRMGEAQQVTLDSIIGAFDPRVALLLAARPNGIPDRLPQGRSPMVPPTAVPVSGSSGSSAYRPGGLTDPVWLFDDSTGLITSVCSFAGSDLAQLVPATDCVNQPSVLISGFVRYSFGASPDAAAPADTALQLAVEAPGARGSVDGDCFAINQSPPTTETPYACRVAVGTNGWNGTVKLAPPDLNAVDGCRYVNALPGNAGHPQQYALLKASLTDQNFLVVSQATPCPTGTEAHQPPLP